MINILISAEFITWLCVPDKVRDISMAFIDNKFSCLITQMDMGELDVVAEAKADTLGNAVEFAVMQALQKDGQRPKE